MKPRPRTTLLLAAAFVSLSVGACGEDSASTVGAPEGRFANTSIEPPSEPSALARSEFAPAALQLYLETGEDHEIDWAVIAAVDRIDGTRGGTATEANRVASIGFGLAGAGAPESYRAALVARGGSAAYAQQVLALADRYREVAERPRPTTGPFELPVDGHVLAAYGERYGQLHDGIDVAAAEGDPIRAPAPGIVLSTGFSSVYGEYTCLLHRLTSPPGGERDLTSCYGNQSSYATEPGAHVRQGELIGRVGCTGPCLRPHLHFQVRLGNSPISPPTDPAPYLPAGIRIEAGRPLGA